MMWRGMHVHVAFFNCMSLWSILTREWRDKLRVMWLNSEKAISQRHMISILQEGQKWGGDNIENDPKEERGWLQNSNLLPKGVWR